MAKQGHNILATLLELDSQDRIYSSKLELDGGVTWSGLPLLSAAGPDHALLHFAGGPEAWVCRVVGHTLEVSRLPAALPVSGGFGGLPLLLPDGNLLAAGGWPPSRTITGISLNRAPYFLELGKMPGPGRHCVSTTLAAGHFVLGFGGWGTGPLDELWVFDLKTGLSSEVRKEKAWHPASSLVPLVVQRGELWLLGGRDTSKISHIPLKKLAALVEDARVRAALETALGEMKEGKAEAFLTRHLTQKLPESKQETPPADSKPKLLRACTESLAGKPQEVVTTSVSSAHSAALERLQNALEASQHNLLKTQNKLDAVSASLSFTLERLKGAEEGEEAAAKLRDELESARRRCGMLEAQLRAARVDESSLRVPLTFCCLPVLGFALLPPPNGRPRFSTVRSLEVHTPSLPRNQGFQREYRQVFGLFLTGELSMRLLAADGLAPAVELRGAAARQVAAALPRGALFPNRCGLPLASRAHPLRPDAKLMDSREAGCWRELCETDCPLRRSVRESAPASFQVASAILEAYDPLQPETRMAATGRLRWALHTRTKARGAGGLLGIDESILFLQRMQKRLEDSRPGEDWRIDPLDSFGGRK